jgi:hypothetical protein|uniref:Uncharacterized protein n=1 Tax=Arabidopsis thaliana TaxID=3702 RepID=Q0WNB6_ARATH|nr:hypothetical protein [Arabidopsis thaliana]
MLLMMVPADRSFLNRRSYSFSTQIMTWEKNTEAMSHRHEEKKIGNMESEMLNSWSRNLKAISA